MVGPSNALAVAALDAWPQWPHPVLFLHGPAGSGKSHLAAVWKALAGAEDFDPSRFDPAGTGFAVLLDDLDRRDVDEGPVFALLNAARLGGGTVLVTARSRPAGLPLSTPDLGSRLRAATTIELGAPDDELLAGVLAKLFADRQIAIDPGLIRLMVPRMERSLEAAGRLAERIDRETLASGRRPTRRLLLDLIDEFPSEKSSSS